MLLKNLSPKFLDNRMIDQYEGEIRIKAYESIGMQMIFDICELLREKICEINDNVNDKYEKIQEAKEERERQESAPVMSNADNLNYTPVN